MVEGIESFIRTEILIAIADYYQISTDYIFDIPDGFSVEDGQVIDTCSLTL